MFKKHLLSCKSTLLCGVIVLWLVAAPFPIGQNRLTAESRGFSSTWENFVAGTRILSVDRVNNTIKVTQPDAPIKINQFTRIRKCEINLLIEDLRVGDIVSVGPISNIEGLKVREISKANDLRIRAGQKPVNEIGKLVLETPFLAITREQQIDSIGTLRVYAIANGTSYVDISVSGSDAERVSFTRYTRLNVSDLMPGQVITGAFYRSNEPGRENELGTEHFEVVIEKTKGFNGRFKGRLPE